MRTRLLLLVVVIILVSSGCAKDDSEAEQSRSTTTTTQSTTTPAEIVDPARDKTRAEALVLTQDDLPAGWTVKQPSPDDASATTHDELDACIGAPDPDTVESASVEGATFYMGGGTNVTSSARFVQTAEDAQADFAALKGDELLPCAEQALTAGLEAEFAGQEVVVEDVIVSSLTVSRVGEETLGFRAEVSLSIEGDVRAFFVDIVLILDGRAELSVDFFSAGEPFDPALQDDLVNKVGDKLAA